MTNWNNFLNQEPSKINGIAYEFCVEMDTPKSGKYSFPIVAIWYDFDWNLPHFELFLDYKNTSGTEYFKVYKAKYWREFKATNVVC